MHWDDVSNIVYIYFLIVVILTSLSILLVRNPIYSIFLLIIVFLHIGFILLLLNTEFLAFLIFIVYLGAIAILFLFVIMMFNIHILETRDNIIRYIPLVIGIFLILIGMSYIMDYINFKFDVTSFKETSYLHKNNWKLFNSKDNIKIISIIYNYYFDLFIIASLILFIAIINAVIVTLNSKVDLKNQIYYIQNNKNLYNSIRLRKRNLRKFYKKFK